jgi:hypothetical protein
MALRSVVVPSTIAVTGQWERASVRRSIAVSSVERLLAISGMCEEMSM